MANWNEAKIIDTILSLSYEIKSDRWTHAKTESFSTAYYKSNINFNKVCSKKPRRFWVLCQKFCKKLKIIRSKHSSWWRRFSSSSSEDIFKTSSRRLHQDQCICLTHTSSEDVFKTFSRRLQNFFKTYWQDVFKISLRHLQDIFKTSSKCLQDIFKTFSGHLQDVFKTLWRRYQDVFKTYHHVKLFLLTRFQDFFKIYSKRFWDVLQRHLSMKGFA